MARQYTLPDGKKLSGGAFSINSFSFPANWLDLATPDDLTHWGITVEVLPDPEPVQVRRMVQKSTIIRRLYEAGLLPAARQALDSDLYARERWYSPDKPALYFDEPEALGFLQSIGADPAVIMAEE